MTGADCVSPTAEPNINAAKAGRIGTVTSTIGLGDRDARTERPAPPTTATNGSDRENRCPYPMIQAHGRQNTHRRSLVWT